MIFYLVMIPAMFIVAVSYASVGLGGGTAYLSVLSFWNADPDTLRPMSWGLNVVVAAVGVWNFKREGHLVVGDIWHYLIGGILGGVLGALMPISPTLFRWLLAVTMAILAIRMLIDGKKKGGGEPLKETVAWPMGLFLGFAPGFLSGLVGIGGGIVLGPIVLALGLLPIKRTAALTATYILVVSASALGGHFAKGGTLPWTQFAVLAVVVLIGGFLGSRYGAGKASARTLQWIFGVIVLVAAVNLTLKALGG